MKITGIKCPLRQLKKSKYVISKERDKLRAVLEEYEEILQSADEALEDIDRVIDTLSQYV